MTFNQASSLCDEIVQFLIECGAPYRRVTGHMEAVVLDALRTGQYLLKVTPEGIRYFVCFWCIQPEDVPPVMSGEFPQSTEGGPIVCIADAGNKDGTAGLREITRGLKEKVGTWEGVMWNRYGKGWQIFSRCRGERDGQD